MPRGAIALLVVTVLCRSASAQDAGPVVHEGIVGAPLAKVWAAFTTTDGLRAWLAPHAEIDLRVGGLMRVNYDTKGQLGDPHTIENTVLSFEPGRMLSIKISKPPANFPFPNAVRQMWTVVYFEPDGPSRTKVREVTLGFGADDESQNMRAFFASGNATTLAQLQRHFAVAGR
jgi:uncharacterized protein YndB with AHSA1/START domain